jgi:hypothetical protein
MHLHVDVDRPAHVPAGIDGAEDGEALRVGSLDPAHEGAARGARAEAGVDAGRVGVPDVDRGALDGPARRRVDDREPERQRRARMAVGDVPADALVRDVVRPFRLLRRQDARDGVGALGRTSPPAPRGDRGDEAAEAEEGLAAGEELHVTTGLGA